MVYNFYIFLHSMDYEMITGLYDFIWVVLVLLLQTKWLCFDATVSCANASMLADPLLYDRRHSASGTSRRKGKKEKNLLLTTWGGKGPEVHRFCLAWTEEPHDRLLLEKVWFLLFITFVASWTSSDERDFCKRGRKHSDSTKSDITDLFVPEVQLNASLQNWK